jgi:hypothetical protein
MSDSGPELTDYMKKVRGIKNQDLQSELVQLRERLAQVRLYFQRVIFVGLFEATANTHPIYVT